MFEGIIEKNNDKKNGQPSFAILCVSEKYPMFWSIADLKYRKLSEFIGISVCKNKILIDNPIIPITKSEKNTLFERNEILSSNFSFNILFTVLYLFIILNTDLLHSM